MPEGSRGRIAAFVVCVGILLCAVFVVLYKIKPAPVSRDSEAKKMSLQAKSSDPESAYQRFYDALAGGDMETARLLLSDEERSRFDEATREDADFIKRQVQSQARLRKLYEGVCDSENICRRFAVYEYDYEISTGYWKEINDRKFYVNPGRQRLEMRFIELPEGGWRISQL